MPVLSSLTAPRTQKARGIRELMTNDQLRKIMWGTRPPAVGEYYLIQVGDHEDLARFTKWWNDRAAYWNRIGLEMRMFARPCPVIPAHGFVDSRVVTTLEDVMEVVKETEEEDGEGEVLVVPFINASTNIVIVPQSGVITIGKGHDGATSGGDGVFNLFVVPDGLYEHKESLESAGIEKGKHAFFELVKDDDHTHLVQVRSGAALPSSTDFIPRKVKVSEIITIKGQPSLLDYRNQMAALAGQDGLVVVLSEHGLASHYALHCIENNIPVLCQPETLPEIGDELSQQDYKAPFDLSEYVIGYRIAERAGIEDGLRLAITIIHNAAKLVSSPAWSRLSGFSTAMIFKAAATACIGEFRYYHNLHNKIERSVVYKSHRHMRLEWLNKKVVGTVAMFMHSKRWEGGGNVGGRKWSMASVKAVKLFNRISAGEHEAAFTEANELLNYAHNGGWLFNKFLPEGTMDNVANNPATAVLTSLDKLINLMSLDPSQSSFPAKFWRGMRARKVRTSPTWVVNEAVVGAKPDDKKCACLHHLNKCTCFVPESDAAFKCDAMCTRRYIYSDDYSPFVLRVDGKVWQPLWRDKPEWMAFLNDMAVEV